MSNLYIASGHFKAILLWHESSITYNMKENKVTRIETHFKKPSLEEKKRIVALIEDRARNSNKPIYQVCQEFPIQMYHYYNWSRSIAKKEAKKFKTKSGITIIVANAEELYKLFPKLA